MDAPKKWRLRFGLRALLGVVTVCAVGGGVYRYCKLPPHEVRQLSLGMEREAIFSALGRPAVTDVSDTLWVYEYEWGEIWLTLDDDGQTCRQIEYFPNSIANTAMSYIMQPDGTFELH